MDFNIEWHDRLGSTNASMRERFYAPGAMASGLVIAAHAPRGAAPIQLDTQHSGRREHDAYD